MTQLISGFHSQLATFPEALMNSQFEYIPFANLGQLACGRDTKSLQLVTRQMPSTMYPWLCPVCTPRTMENTHSTTSIIILISQNDILHCSFVLLFFFL